MRFPPPNSVSYKSLVIFIMQHIPAPQANNEITRYLKSLITENLEKL